MKIFLRKSLLLIAAAVALASCDADISGSLDKDGDPGTADFSTFVALGDSLTAGFADNALYRHGQENSYPAIMAQQFALAGGGIFEQPLMPVGATGSMTLTGIGDLGLADRLMLVATGNPDSPAAPGTIIPTQSTSIDVPLIGPFNNMGVAGAKSYHLGANTYGNPAALPNANPYYIRFASSTAATMVGDAAIQVPTFFILWIGNNDVLSYATSGGSGVQGAGPPPYGANDITDPAFFPAIYGGILGALNTPTNKGVLINIPDVTTIPFFTTVPYNAIPLDAATAAALNATLAAGFNAYLDAVAGIIGADEVARRRLAYSSGQNPVLIVDETLTDLSGLPGFPAALTGLEFARQATADDYIVLPTSTKLGTEAVPGNPASTWGVSNPLVDADVLTAAEVAIVEAARNPFNVAIKAAADADPNLLLFDAEAKLTELNDTGISYGSGGITSEFATGGAFSLDGVHPTARGYAVISNEIFKVINAGFDAYIPPVDPSAYTTVFYQ